MQALRPDWSRPSASRSSKENRRPALFRAGRFCRKKPPARPVVMIGKVVRYVRKIPHAAAHSVPCAGSLSHLLRCCRAGHERRPVRARQTSPDGLTVRYADVAADYPRQTVTFSSGSAQLTGWLYPAEDAAALVVIAHGLGADAETYLPETMHFVDSGYSVLTYDAHGSRAAGGSGTRGLAQSALIWMPPDPRRTGGLAHFALRPQLGRLCRRGCAGRQPRRDSLRLRGRI